MITGIDLRLDAIPRERGSAKIALGRLESLGEIVPALLHHGPSAVELLDRTFLDLVRGAGRKGLPGVPAESEAILIVDFEGDDEDMVRGAVSDVAETARPWALDVETALSPEDDQRLWALRHAASPIMAGLSETRRAMQVVEDGCVPVARLSEYIRFLRHAAETHRLEAVIFGHAGDGNIHVNLLPEVVRRGWQDEVAGMMAEVTAQIIALGGTTTGEHGDGRLRAGSLEKQYGVEIVSLFRSVKAAFDPAGILNPGVILPTGKSSPIDRLKMGADAVDLPVDIARSLREIERTGGYARDRMELAG
jgi:FAD/FMN-containing dehydrogenase